MIFAFGDRELDTDTFELRYAGAAVNVAPQVFDVLTYLVSHRDRVVTKEELLDEVWGDRFVSESALTSRIKDARRALEAVRADAAQLDVARATAETDLSHLAQSCADTVQATLDEVASEVQQLEREGMHMLLVSEPVLGADEKAALAAVIDSGWVTMGDRVHEFEQVFARMHQHRCQRQGQ